MFSIEHMTVGISTLCSLYKSRPIIKNNNKKKKKLTPRK
jgi:hypothetical protein